MGTHTSSSASSFRQLWQKLEAFVWVALMLTPLVMDLGAYDDAYYTPKWAWLATWGFLALLLRLIDALRGRPLWVPFHPFMLGALLTAFIPLLRSLAPAASPSLAWDRTGQFLILSLLWWLAIQVWQGRRSLLVAARWLTFVVVVTALWVLLEDVIAAWWPQYGWLRPKLPDWRGFISAGLGNTNHLGDLLILGILPMLVMFGETRRRRTAVLLGLLIIIATASLIICFSVGSNLGLLLGAGVMAGMMLRSDGLRWFTRRKGRWAGLVAGWVVVLLWLNLDWAGNPHAPGILVQGFGSGRWHEGGPTRLAIWAQTLAMIQQHPWWGVGPGNFTYYFPTMDSALLWSRPDLLMYQGLWTNAAHQWFLQQWAEMGLPGLFLPLIWLALGAYCLFPEYRLADAMGRRLRVALAGMSVAWVAHAQMNFVFQHPVGMLTGFALAWAIYTEWQTRPEHRLQMPSFRWRLPGFSLVLKGRSMRQPTAFGVALHLPPSAVWVTSSAIFILGVVLLLPSFWAPVRAQRWYRRGIDLEMQAFRLMAMNPNLPQVQETEAKALAAYERALEIDPDATGCRSHLSAWLIDSRRPQHRWDPQRTLEELAIVRTRLNSNELWVREAQAWQALGNPQRAQAAMEIYRSRMHPR